MARDNVVVSKFFSKKIVMDESLTDFQTPKSSCIGPKKVTKSKANSKPKPRKRDKGQRDIRTLVKSKNDLLSYSKDFDQICKHTGVDIDSEELQLAIALSKSLQEANCVDDITTKPLTTRERKNKIRKTLQEYGFTIPNCKITTNTKKRKKYKKNYSLLCTTDIEKEQRISNKYDYILKNNLHTPKFSTFYNLNENNNMKIYYKATNVCYNEIKNVDIFYVPDLVPKSIHVTSMLRDWSTIPGRPISPKPDIINFNFYEHEFAQEQLDCILSYPLKTAQNIIKNIFVIEKDLEIQAKITKNIFEPSEESTSKPVFIDSSSNLNENQSNYEKKFIEICDTNMDLFTLKNRSESPDLFDDDELCIVDSKDLEPILDVKSQINFSGNSCMDFTECVNKNCTYEYRQTCQLPEKDLNSKNHEKVSIEVINDKDLKMYQQGREDIITKKEHNNVVSKTIDLTNFSIIHSTNMFVNNNNYSETVNKTNDFMEVTECVNSNYNQQQNEKKAFTEYSDKDNRKKVNCTKVMGDSLYKETTKADIVKENIIIEKEYFNSYIKPVTETSTVQESVDLTQSSESMEDFPIVQISGTQKENSFDDTVIINDNSISSSIQDKQFTTGHENNIDSIWNDSAKVNRDCNTSIQNRSKNDINGSTNTSIDANDDCLDLTQNLQIPVQISGREKDNSFDDTIIDTDIINENAIRSSIQHIQSTTEKENNVHSSIWNDSDTVNRDCDASVQNKSKNDITVNTNANDDCFDLTQNLQSPVKISGRQEENSFDDTVIINEKAIGSSIQHIQSLMVKGNDIHSSIWSDSAKLNRECDVSVQDKSKTDINVNTNASDDCLDLTQNLQSPYDISFNRNSLKNYPRSEVLGKTDNVSIDYDELYDKMKNDEISNDSYTAESSNNKSIEKAFQSVRDSLEFNHNIEDNFNFGGISLMDNIPINDTENVSKNTIARCEIDTYLPEVKCKHNIAKTSSEKKLTQLTPTKIVKQNKPTTQTPLSKKYIIKECNVTPMLDYESMSSPERNKELEKYGIKPFKRKRAVQLLTYIYNQTHPIVAAECLTEEVPSTSKKLKINIPESISSPKQTARATVYEESGLNIENVNSLYLETKQNPDIRDIGCDVDEWVFPTREQAKVRSCRVPLHIAFHNYVSCRSHLRAAILRYEPINIDIIHKDLVASGYRYNHKDLLKFLDKKCITVKTEENNSRNKKHNNRVQK